MLQCDRNKEVLGLVQVLPDNSHVKFFFFFRNPEFILGFYTHSSILSEDSDFKIWGTETWGRRPWTSDLSERPGEFSELKVPGSHHWDSLTHWVQNAALEISLFCFSLGHDVLEGTPGAHICWYLITELQLQPESKIYSQLPGQDEIIGLSWHLFWKLHCPKG